MKSSWRPILFLLLLSLPLMLAGQEPLTKKERKKIRKQSRKLLKNARKHYEAEEYQQATNLLDSILVLDDTNPDAHYYYGMIYTMQGDTTQADSILSRGIEIAPKSARLKTMLARLKLAKNDAEGTLSLTDAVLAINPHNAEALYLKGLGLLLKNDTLPALDLLEKASEIAIAKEEK